MIPEPHDFTKPAPLAPDWHARISSWLRLAIGLASKAWAKELPTPIEASLGNIETCWASAGLAVLTDTMIGYHVQIAGPRLPTFLVFPRASLIKIVGLLLGESEGEVKDREFTMVEEKLAEYFLSQMWLKYFRETWPGTEIVTWSLAESESNPGCSRIFSADENLIRTTWHVKGTWGTTDAIWLWPRKQLCVLLGGAAEFAGDAISPEILAARREGLVHALPVSLEVELGTAQVRLSELSNLRVGDVILLDQRVEEQVVIRTGGHTLFRGRPGRIGSRIALRIESKKET